jgi:chorismate mutase
LIYETEIYKLRRQIDKLDNELLKKILKLSQLVKNCKQNINSKTEYIPFANSELMKLARKKDLDENAILRIFKEITQLIEAQELNQ